MPLSHAKLLAYAVYADLVEAASNVRELGRIPMRGARAGVEGEPLSDVAWAAAFLTEIGSQPGHRSLALTYHGDADGLCAARCLTAALDRAGIRFSVNAPRKGEHAHSASLLARLAALEPTGLVVMDMGSRPEPLLPDVPSLVIDHHRPEGFPPGALVVSSYGRQLPEPASLLAYLVGASMQTIDDLMWVAAAGVAGDLGTNVPFPTVTQALARYGKRAISETASLLNAARRAPAYDLETAFEALCQARVPQEIVRGESAASQELHRYRREVQEEVQRWSRTAPVVVGEIALIPIHSAAQIHSLLATRWMRRLANAIVVAANYGYRPGWVHFSARSFQGRNLLEFLEPTRAYISEGDVGYGHDRATGGVLPVEQFDRLLDAWGFSGTARERVMRAA